MPHKMKAKFSSVLNKEVLDFDLMVVTYGRIAASPIAKPET